MEDLIEELTKVGPDELSTDGLKLFNKINEIIDKNKELEEENEKLKAKANFKLYISGMQNGKELLQKTLADYNDLSIKVLKLQSITSYIIDDLIGLFLKGYTLQKDYIPVSLVEEKIEELKLIINKYEKQIENDEETDLSYEEIRNYASKLEAFEELLEKRK